MTMASGPGRFDGKVAVITGGASGIGEAITRMVVAEGGAAVIADRDECMGSALAAELGDAARFCRTDVVIEADVAASVSTATSAFGHLDVMCNNAGIVGADRPLAETTIDDYEQVMTILLRGVFLGTKHAALAMSPETGGSIINTSSVAGLSGGLGPVLYTTAKHGIIGLTRSAAAELAPMRIRVNAIAPGGIPTPMAARMITGDPANVAAVAARIAARSPLGRSSTTQDVAEAVAYLASPAASYVTGQVLVVDGGASVGVPRLPPAP